jgi:hypothetical protein
VAEQSGVIALLRDATRRFDASPAIQEAAWRSGRRGFQGGAEWMALALAEIRGGSPARVASGAARLGFIKYGAASLAAGVVVALAAALGRFEILPLAVVAFYAVEARSVFVFPAFADGTPDPFSASRALVASAGGTAAVAGRTMVIASVMLLGGFVRFRFLRAWCIGCLAVTLWYERLRP